MKWLKARLWQCAGAASQLDISTVSLKHDGTDGTDGPVKSVNTDGTAIERADGKGYKYNCL